MFKVGNLVMCKESGVYCITDCNVICKVTRKIDKYGWIKVKPIKISELYDGKKKEEIEEEIEKCNSFEVLESLFKSIKKSNI